MEPKRLMLLVGAVALLAHATAGAQPLTKVRVSIIPIIDTAPLIAAMQKGYFAAEGIEVDTTPTVSGATGLPALAAGQIHIALSNVISIILGYDQGLGFQMIAVTSASSDAPPNSAGIVARKGANFKTGKDLEGKRVAVNARNNINWLVTREWVQLTGGNPERLTFLEVPFPNMGDAVRGNQIDAAFMVDPFLSSGIASGATELVGWPYDTIMKRVPIAQYAATRSYIQANPALIERWVRAYNKGIDWINDNKGTDEWLKLIAGYTRLTPDQLKNVSLPLWPKTVDPKAIEKMAARMRKHGLLERNIDIKGMLHRPVVEPVN